MDVDGSLLGYQSDLTRTMLPDTTLAWGLFKVDNTWPDERSEKIWTTVRRAQEAALRSLEREENVEVRAMDVDRAARSVIEAEGWGKYFSHRLGHGKSVLARSRSLPVKSEYSYAWSQVSEFRSTNTPTSTRATPKSSSPARRSRTSPESTSRPSPRPPTSIVQGSVG
jgi:hypothetical protein